MDRVTRRHKAANLGVFLLVSVLAGVLVAGLAIPAAALTGATSSLMSRSMSLLSDELATPPQPQRTTFFLANGKPFATFYDENRILVTLDEIAPIMQQAQVAIEDDRFYEHGALDLKALVKAMLTFVGSSSGGGGSTLTQQYVKQVQIEKAMTITDKAERDAQVAKVQERSVQRKIQEARYAVALEERLSKDQILENYLNIAYYGDGAYGVEAAAHHYYNTSAAKLTLAQATMLAGIVQLPSRNPVSDLAGALERRTVVLDRMVELGLVTEADAEAAKAEPFDPKQVRNVPNGCASSKYSILCEFTRKTLMQNPALGDTVEERSAALLRGGYNVYTVIDPTKQDAVQKAVSDRFDPRDPVIATLVYVEPGTGKILAMAQNRYQLGTDFDKGETAYVFTADEALGGAEGFQAGSTFKAFTAAAALDRGIPPSTTFNAAARMQFGGKVFATCDSDTMVSNWSVGNSGSSGVMDMYHGAALSVNTYFVQLEQLVGICHPIEMAIAAGVKLSNGENMLDDKYMVPSWTLGVVDVTPLSMATAFATFAANGKRCDPIIIDKIIDSLGIQVPTQSANCHQTIRPEVAKGVNQVLSNVFTYGTAGSIGGLPGREASGKSGTTDSGRALWFMGYTPQVVGAATIAVYSNPKFSSYWSSHGYSLYGRTMPVSGFYVNGVGSIDSGRMWKEGMLAVIKGKDPVPFDRPPAEILNGQRVSVPDTTGLSEAEARRVLQAEHFFVPPATKVYSDLPVGTLVSATCNPVMGGTCTLSVSQGPRPAPPPPPPVNPGEPGGGGDQQGGG